MCMKNQIQQHNNNKKEIAFQLSLPFDVEVKIDVDDSVRTLIEVTERMDYSKLNAAYKRLPNEEYASPKQMFQLVILGFIKDIYSTRKLESASKNDIRFMYILNGKAAPDHNRFATFIKYRLCGEVAENLFYQLVHYLEAEQEIDFENIFIDGTKIEACANRYSFVWKKSTNRYEKILDKKLEEMKNHLMVEYPLLVPPDAPAEEYLKALLLKSSGIKFVYGRGKRKSQIQKDVETLKAYLLRKNKYEVYNKTFKGRNSFSKTDKDATFMRMKDDHMRNGQLKPAYNLQLGIEGEYIVGVDISSERSDHLTLLPFLDRMQESCGKLHKNIILDAGYESEENYKGLKEREITAYIKPQNYEQSKKRKYKSNAFLRENMPYCAETDTYICPNGNIFSYLETTTRKSKSGFESEITVYECHGCNECSKKNDCTRAKGNRKFYISKDFIDLRKESLLRITSEHGKKLRINRSIQSEGAFGVLKQNHGFRRFLRRGFANVFTETILYAFAHNINKLHNKRKNELQGVILHALKSA